MLGSAPAPVANANANANPTVSQPIVLVLLDIPPMLPVLDGVVMELQDCALPLLRGEQTLGGGGGGWVGYHGDGGLPDPLPRGGGGSQSTAPIG